MISLSYLFEGKITEHFKRNWGKYALGAGAVALAAEPEVSYGYHKAAVNKLADEIQSGDTDVNQKLRKGMDLLRHGKKAYDANERNLLNKRSFVWSDPKTGQEDHVKSVKKYDL